MTEIGSVALTNLQDQLILIKKMTDDSTDINCDTLIKSSISKYVEERLQEGMEAADIEREMKRLCYDLLVVPPNLCNWTTEIVQKKKKSFIRPALQSGKECDPVSNSVRKKLEVTELKDLMYHALLCCQAVNHCDSKSYTKFFNDNGSAFDEVSISICNDRNQDRYVIAKLRNIVFISFLSEPFLSGWLEKLPSFEIGKFKGLCRMKLNKFTCINIDTIIFKRKQFKLSSCKVRNLIW